MSDEASTPAKRGRKAAAAPVEKAESKKRPRKEVKQADSGDEDTAPKRGRGRPKGTTKKKSAGRPKSKSTGGRRGRKKEEKKKDSEDEINEENGDEDEDD